ncbi:LysR family transcription regulator [Chitinimonas naiadis]
MPIPDLELDLLRAFVAVAESGSMTAGAALIGRTQSAVSQKMLRLEEIVGRRLLDRAGRSLSLTGDGERLLVAARRMLEFNDETVRQFVDPPAAGTLRLGVAEDFIPHQLPRLLARFARNYPHIRLELTTGMSCDLMGKLDDDLLDLAIAKRDGEQQRGRVIWQEPLVWIAAEGTDLDPGQPVPLVLLPAPCSYRGIALDALASVERQSVIACTASSLMGVQAAVAGGLGVTLLGRSFVQDGLRVLDPHDGWPTLPTTEIVLLGEDRARPHLTKPLLGFLTESLSSSRLAVH